MVVVLFVACQEYNVCKVARIKNIDIHEYVKIYVTICITVAKNTYLIEGKSLSFTEY